MLILGLLWTLILGNTFSFVFEPVKDTDLQDCTDDPKANCSLLNCSAFPDVASKYCPRTCGICNTHLQHCSDDPKANCSLLNCNAFPEEASKYCPRTCGFCDVCEDKTNTDCTIFTSQPLCTNTQLLDAAAGFCPKHCKFCQPCVDSDTSCTGLRSFCDNPVVAGKCSKSCNKCEKYNATEFLERYYSAHPTTPTTVTTTTKPPSTTTVTTTTKATTSATVTTTIAATVPTSATVTTKLTTQTPIVSKDCDKFGVIVSVAKGDTVSYPDSRMCPDGSRRHSEALIQTYCGAPNTTHWTEGMKVMDNCQSIPHYTAIGAATFGSTVAGVFVKCEAGGFQAAIQTCESQLKLYHVSPSSTSNIPSADKFVLLNWKN